MHVRPDWFSSCCACHELFLGTDGRGHIQAEAFLIYWSPLRSHTAASQLHTSLTSSPQLLSYYSVCCYLVGKSSLVTHVCILDVCSLGKPGQGAEGHQGGRWVLTPLSGKQTTSFCHPLCCFPLKWLICTHTKYFGGMRMFLLLCPLCWMHYPLIITSILPLLRKCWSLLLYVLWLQFFSSGNSWLTWLRFTSLSDLKRPL